ncbi:hypothetical protein [Kitasatospora sp. NPDC051914]|uniref:hypothetical protein n=1 Tax=Kitasatospora sp. NPDC051914 TaxID=3154945 RepID=UPI00341B683C
MTATNDAPDTTAEANWQHIENRLAAIERRIHEHSSAAIATIDTCLARLDALRHDLAHQPWPPQAFFAPGDPPAVPPQQPVPTGSQPRRRTQTTLRHGPADSHQAAVLA